MVLKRIFRPFVNFGKSAMGLWGRFNDTRKREGVMGAMMDTPLRAPKPLPPQPSQGRPWVGDGKFRRGPKGFVVPRPPIEATPKPTPAAAQAPPKPSPEKVNLIPQPPTGTETRRFERREKRTDFVKERIDAIKSEADGIVGDLLEHHASTVESRESLFRNAILGRVISKVESRLFSKPLRPISTAGFKPDEIGIIDTIADEVISKLTHKS